MNVLSRFFPTAVVALAFSILPARAQPPGIIIDQDMSSDHDDVGDLAVLNALTNLGECRMLACMVDSLNGGTALCMNSINTYYGHPNVPIGVRPDIGGIGSYPGQIASEYPHPLYQFPSQCPHAVDLYRRILASEPDHSVSIVTTGYMTNLAALLRSGPDQYSPLSGTELVRQKVKLLSCAGGQYPSGGEFNFTASGDDSASVVVNNWPAPVLYTGFEIGGAIFTGMELPQTPRNNPIRRVYVDITNQYCYPCWGQIAVYNAVRPTESALLWKIYNVGHNTCAPNGVNTWVSDQESAHPQGQGYLLETERYPIQEALNTLIAAPPPGAGPSIPGQPSNVRAEVAHGTVNLRWADNSYNESGFRIERSDNGTYTQIASVGSHATSYSDTSAPSTANVSYRVKAYNSVGDSPYSYVWIYSGWTELNFDNPSNLPLYAYYQCSNLRAINALNVPNHVTLNNDSTHGQEVAIDVDTATLGAEGNSYVYFFYQNPQNWYRLNVSNASSKFEKNVEGTIHQIGTAGKGIDLEVGSPLQHWQISASNTGSLRFFAAQSNILNVSDKLSFTGGKIGLGGYARMPVWQNFHFDTKTSTVGK